MLMAIMIACEPDRVCRQEMDVNAYITITDTGKTYSVYKAALPLRIDTVVTTANIINPIDSTMFQLAIHHQNDRRYISMACGCIIFHDIDSAWTNQPDSYDVQIVNSTVENYEQTNIELLYNIAPKSE